mgnify:CR=1 FL=1
MKEAIVGLLGLIAIPVIRAIANGLKKKESASEIVADVADAALDQVEKKKWPQPITQQ